MFRATLLFVLCGLALSSPPVQKEEYSYSGRMMVGVNNPRQSYAGSVVTMDITVDRHADFSADVTFSNAKAGEFNRQFYIGDDPIVDVANKKAVPALQGTCKVYFNRETGTVMQVKSDQPIWVTNIHKAIISTLKVPAYLGDRSFIDLERNAFRRRGQQNAEDEQLSYFKTEETFAGRCNVSYTMNPDFGLGHWHGSPDDVLPISSEYFRLHRSIDFDSCHNPVGFHKTSVGNFSRVWESQFKDVQDRSAMGEYLLRKRDDGYFDIKGINQQGAQFVRPFGQDTGRVVSNTNQTMCLMKVTKGGSAQSRPVKGAQKDVKTWLYQFSSPAKPKQSTKVEWVLYGDHNDAPMYPELAILGSSEMPSQDNMLKAIKKMLEDVAKAQLVENEDHPKPYNGTTDGRVTEMMHSLSRAIRSLTHKSLKSLFDQTTPHGSSESQSELDRSRRQSLLDASAASGSSPAIQCMVEAAKAKQIDEPRMARMITVLSNNILDPATLPLLVDYVMSLDAKQQTALAIAAHMNFARLAQRVCSNLSLRTYAVPEHYLGEKACNMEAIANKFSDHLRKKLQSAGSVWEAMMYTQSLGSLGMDRDIKTIRDIAMGEFVPEKLGKSIPVRLGALHCLSRNFPEHPQKEKILDQILPLAENHAEDFRVREAAFILIVSMKPNATTFSRFAADTWRDPSYRMRSLVATTLISLADSDSQDFSHLAHIARSWLPRIRPVQPSMQNSLFFNFKTRLPDYNIGVEAKLAWFQKYRSPLAAPQQLLHTIRADYGGIDVPVWEIYTMSDSSSIMSVSARINDARGSIKNPRDSRQREIHQEISEIAESLQMEMQQNSNSFYAYVSYFNYQNFAAFDDVTSPSFFAKIASNLRELSGKPPQPFFPDTTVMYFNPVDVLSILPSPFGLPTIVEIAAPQNTVNKFTFTATVENGIKATNVTLNGLGKTILKTQCYMTMLQPWSKTSAIAGFDTEASLSLPGQVSAVVNNTYPFAIVKTTLSLRTSSLKPLAHWRSKPLSAIMPMGPINDITLVDNLRTCLADQVPTYQKHFSIPDQYVGLKNRITFDGDLDYPFQQANIIEIVQHPQILASLMTTPTSQDFAMTAKVDTEHSETKNISIAAVIDYGYLMNGEKRCSKQGRLDEVGQQLAEQASLNMSPEELATSAAHREIGDFLFSWSINCTAPGKRTRQYAVMMTGANKTSSSSNEYKQSVVLNLVRKGLPGSNGEEKVCLVTSLQEKKKPSGDQTSRDQLFTTASTDIYAGKSCSSSEKVINVNTYMYLRTDERAPQPCPGQAMCSTGPTGSSGSNGYAETAFSHRETQFPDAVYDRIDVESTVVKALPDFYQNMTYWASDMVAGILFPNLIVNRMPGESRRSVPANKIYFNMSRNVASAQADAWIHRPDRAEYISALPIPSILDWSSPILGGHIQYHRTTDALTLSSSGLESHPCTRLQSAPNSYCIVKPTQCETFDGVEYEKVSTSCYTINAQLYHEQESFSVMSRDVSGEKEVNIFSTEAGKIEILAGKVVKINGKIMQQQSEQIKDGSGKVVGSVQKSSDVVTVTLTNKMEITLKNSNELVINMADKYKSLVRGICGDYNGEKAGDLFTPKGCKLTAADGNVLVASWLAKQGECKDPSSMADYIAAAQQTEQEDCKKTLSFNIQNASRSSSPGC